MLQAIQLYILPRWKRRGFLVKMLNNQKNGVGQKNQKEISQKKNRIL